MRKRPAAVKIFLICVLPMTVRSFWRRPTMPRQISMLLISNSLKASWLNVLQCQCLVELKLTFWITFSLLPGIGPVNPSHWFINDSTVKQSKTMKSLDCIVLNLSCFRPSFSEELTHSVVGLINLYLCDLYRYLFPLRGLIIKGRWSDALCLNIKYGNGR